MGRLAALLVVTLLGCSPQQLSQIAQPLCGDAGVVDSPIDAAIDAPPDAHVWNPAPLAVYDDPTGFHPTFTIPTPYNYAVHPEIPRPLVMVLGGYGKAQGLYQQTQWGWQWSHSNGAITLLPTGAADPATSGPQHYWNASRACCDYHHIGNDDVAYLGGLIDRVISAGWNVDRHRVIVAGVSNGGFMAQRLACLRSDIVTTVLSESGGANSVNDTACTPAHPVNFLEIHGTADATVSYNGGSVLFPGLDPTPGVQTATGTMAQWITRNGCTSALVVTQSGAYKHDVALGGSADTNRWASRGCPAGGDVELWQMVPSGHVPAMQFPWPADSWNWIITHSRP